MEDRLHYSSAEVDVPKRIWILLATALALAGCQKIGSIDVVNEGEDCTKGRCVSGLVCAQEGICKQEGELGTFEEGLDCTATEECAYGLVCSAENLCATPGSAGTGEDGDACGSPDDCQAGFYCGDDGSCHDIGIPYWAGGACPADDSESFRAVFEVPRLPVSGEIDFFSLPFPNDFRQDVSGHPELTGFPVPPEAPAVSNLLAAIQTETVGFSREPTVYFRFTQPLDSGSIRVLSADATLHWAAIDPDVQGYGERSSLQYFYRTSRGKYICQNWLSVSTYEGETLPSGQLQAVWVTSGLKNKSGKNAARDEEFEMMMADTPPEGYALGLAWNVYAPFRHYLSDQGIDPTTVVSAAVFTPGSPQEKSRTFSSYATGTTTVKELVRCDSGVQGPCDNGTPRCNTDPQGYDELQGILSVPNYTDADGRVRWDSFGRPVVQGQSDVCFTMSVPEGDAPETGWPAAVFSPDLGNDDRMAITSGLAEALAAKGLATLSLELPQQGARQTGNYAELTDPTLWLSNILQHIGDIHAGIQVGRSLDLAADQSPTTHLLRLDPDRLWLVGAGQGANAVTAALAWSSSVQGGVLGNPTGWLSHWLSDAYTPIDYAHGLQAAFADSSLDARHPMMNMLELYMEPADPMVYADGIVRDPLSSAKHVLGIDGIQDATGPRAAVQALWHGFDIPTIGTVLDDYGQTTGTAPATENVTTDDGRRTAGVVQFSADQSALYGPGLSVTADFLGSADSAAPTIQP